MKNFQAELEEIILWAGENNMQFNKSKFELLRYGRHTDIIAEFSYNSSNNSLIVKKESLRVLDAQMQNNASFDEQVAKFEAGG